MHVQFVNSFKEVLNVVRYKLFSPTRQLKVHSSRLHAAAAATAILLLLLCVALMDLGHSLYMNVLHENI